MPETILSIAERELCRFSTIDRKRLEDAGATKKIINSLNATPDVKRMLTLPGENDLGTSAYYREVQPEHHDRIYEVINDTIRAMAERALLG